MKSCTSCGSEIPPEAEFCPGCGAQASAPSPRLPRGPRPSAWFAAVPVLLFLALVVGAWLVQQAHSLNPPRNARAGQIWKNPKDEKEMVFVPAGEFLMGSSEKDEAADGDERPQFRRDLPGFWIDKCEVTVAEYRKFCGATGGEMPDEPPWGWQDKHPMVNVTWEEARAYADWAGERLPTEAEWEKAARGTDGRTYPWGEEWDESKCVNAKNSKGAQPVGSRPSDVSPYGCLDMAGNVWEWCEECYDEKAYQRYAGGDLTVPGSGRFSALRGGCWLSGSPRHFRVAERHWPCGSLRAGASGGRSPTGGPQRMSSRRGSGRAVGRGIGREGGSSRGGISRVGPSVGGRHGSGPPPGFRLRLGVIIGFRCVRNA